MNKTFRIQHDACSLLLYGEKWDEEEQCPQGVWVSHRYRIDADNIEHIHYRFDFDHKLVVIRIPQQSYVATGHFVCGAQRLDFVGAWFDSNHLALQWRHNKPYAKFRRKTRQHSTSGVLTDTFVVLKEKTLFKHSRTVLYDNGQKGWVRFADGLFIEWGM